LFLSNYPTNTEQKVQMNDIHYEQLDPPTYSITVNLNAHTLTLFKDGKINKVYPVAVGKASTPTPKGDYKIVNRQLHPGGAFGIRWLGLNIPGGNYGIHGTNNPSSIGKSISHGCIRMYNNDVLELSNLVPIGTTVKII
jgi:lipoprotein-anchoring transpeptidase ErfK/SrfK